MSQVLNSVFQALLSLLLLGILVGFCLFFCGVDLCLRSLSLRVRGVLQRLGSSVGNQGL